MKKNYAVLNDKLFPCDVAELLLSEGLGESFTSVEMTVMPDQFPDFSDLGKFLLNVHRKGIVHSWTAESISEMLVKLIKNNNLCWEDIGVKLIQGNKTFLYADFSGS